MAKGLHSTHISSLEMLLDTMCNTFGCIIFVAILLAVLSQQVGRVIEAKRQTGVSASAAQRQTARAEQLQAEIARLQQTAQALRALRELKPVALPDLRPAVEAAAEQTVRTRADSARTKQEAETAATRVDRLQQEVQRLQGLVRELQGQVGGVAPALPREFRVPQLHPANPETVFNCALQGGRFYAVRRLPPDSGFDPDDVEVAKGPNGSFIVRLRPTGGVAPTADPQTAAGKLGQALALDPQRVMIEFSVYPDSFQEFITVKQWFVQRGFSYNWRPHPLDLPLVYTPAQSVEQQ